MANISFADGLIYALNTEQKKIKLPICIQEKIKEITYDDSYLKENETGLDDIFYVFYARGKYTYGNTLLAHAADLKDMIRESEHLEDIVFHFKDREENLGVHYVCKYSIMEGEIEYKKIG